MRRIALGLLLLALTPATASATTRYAAEGGDGNACTAAKPCLLADAVGGAQAGDVVRVASGTHELLSDLDVDAPIRVEGETAGGARPVVSSDDAIDVRAGAVLRDLDLLLVGGLRFGDGALVERVNALGGSAACVLRPGAILRDSICQALQSSGEAGVRVVPAAAGAVSPAAAVRIDGVTALGIPAVDEGADVPVTATDTIARRWSGAHDVASDGGLKLVNVAAPDIVGTTDVSGQVKAPPALDATFRPTAGSPVLDAGSTTAPGRQDLAGNARVIGGRADLGARERVAAPPAIGPAPPTLSPRRATLRADVDAGGGATTGYVEWWTGASTPARVPLDRRLGTVAPFDPAVVVPGLAPATTYRYRVVVESDRGVTVGPDWTFTTPTALPLAVTGDASAVTDRSATIAGTADTRGLPGTAVVELTPAGGATVTSAPTAVPAFVGDQPVGVDVSGLPASTDVAYRLVVTTDEGTVRGETRTLRTTPAPPPALDPAPQGGVAGVVETAIAGPRLSVRQAKRSGARLLRGKPVKLALSCGDLPCRVTVRATTKRGKRTVSASLSRRSLRLAADRTGTITLRLPKALRRPGATVTIRATVRSADGKTVRRTAYVDLPTRPR